MFLFLGVPSIEGCPSIRGVLMEGFCYKWKQLESVVNIQYLAVPWQLHAILSTSGVSSNTSFPFYFHFIIDSPPLVYILNCLSPQVTAES